MIEFMSGSVLHPDTKNERGVFFPMFVAVDDANKKDIPISITAGPPLLPGLSFILKRSCIIMSSKQALFTEVGQQSPFP